jgi:hypothetical protein
MSRTNLPVSTLSPSVGVLNPSATNIDQANGMNVVLASSAIPSAAGANDLVLIVTQTSSSTRNVIIRAGASNPPAFRKDLGDLTIACTATTTNYLGPLEVARFAQSDGSINIDFQASATGTIMALLVPRTAI